MSSITTPARVAARGEKGSRVYWSATGFFCAAFTLSALSYFVDPTSAGEVFERLGFPDRLVYPVAVAKLLGVAVILWGRSRTLTTMAFAGFLFDLLLAFQGHVANRESDVILAVLGLAAWTAAFWADRRRYGPMVSARHAEQARSAGGAPG